MLNPIFNLPSFLIGIFFGLINYSIQKGINLYGSDSYQKIFNLENRDSVSSDSKDSESNDGQTILKRQITLDKSERTLSIKLDKYAESKYRKEQHDDIKRSNTLSIRKDKEIKIKIKSSNKNAKQDLSVKSDNDSKSMPLSPNEGYNEKIKEIPFLILPTKFLNFHRQNEGRFFFKLIIIIFIFLTALISCAHFFVVGAYVIVDGKKDDKKTTLEKLSFRKVITSHFLNVLYSIDIDLIVFMVNWLFFIIYSKGKNDDIYDFF